MTGIVASGDGTTTCITGVAPRQDVSATDDRCDVRWARCPRPTARAGHSLDAGRIPDEPIVRAGHKMYTLFERSRGANPPRSIFSARKYHQRPPPWVSLHETRSAWMCHVCDMAVRPVRNFLGPGHSRYLVANYLNYSLALGRTPSCIRTPILPQSGRCGHTARQNMRKNYLNRHLCNSVLNFHVPNLLAHQHE